ncbi:peptide-methionine (S)-S-oxide reductase MsrA [Isosphaeraceae bacterium EP7]
MLIRSSAACLGICLVLASASAPAIEDARAKPKATAADPVPADSEKPAAKPELDAEGATKSKAKPKGRPKTEVATFGAGCFWSTEAVFERLPGVLSVDSGFSGGQVPNPSYELVCSGTTGHAEVVNVRFDPDVTTYDALLNAFWTSHDPTTPNRQGDDFGTQYRSAIFYHSEAQKKAALKSYRELTTRNAFRGPIVTELLPFGGFYPAEPYHQDYFRTNRGSDYSLIYIIPKLRKLHLLDTKPRSAAHAPARRPLDRARTIGAQSTETQDTAKDQGDAPATSGTTSPPAPGR